MSSLCYAYPAWKVWSGLHGHSCLSIPKVWKSGLTGVGTGNSVFLPPNAKRLESRAFCTNFLHMWRTFLSMSVHSPFRNRSLSSRTMWQSNSSGIITHVNQKKVNRALQLTLIFTKFKFFMTSTESTTLNKIEIFSLKK